MDDGPVEFIGPGLAPGDPTEDDLIEFGPRRQRRLPVVIVVGAVLLAALVVGLVAQSRPARPQPQAVARSSPASTAVASVAWGRSAPYAATASGVGRALLPDTSDVQDVAYVGSQLVVLAYDRLLLADARRGTATRSVGLGQLDPFDAGPSFVLVPDPARDRVWLISLGATPTQLLEYDLRTMRQTRHLSAPWVIGSTATLGGTLYLTTPAGLAEIGPTASRPSLVGGLGSMISSVAADPSRHRLLLAEALGDGAGLSLVAWAPGAGAHTLAPLGITKGDIVVVDGQLWEVGFGPDGAVLAQIEVIPAGLAVAPVTTIALGPGAQLEASGQHVLWVRSSAGGGRLWCVGGLSGEVEQTWPEVDGPVASIDGQAVVTLNSTARTLALAGCEG